MTWMCWNNSTKSDELAYIPFVHLAERFTPPVDQKVPKEEFEDYRLMEDTEIYMEEAGVLTSVD